MTLSDDIKRVLELDVAFHQEAEAQKQTRLKMFGDYVFDTTEYITLRQISPAQESLRSEAPLMASIIRQQQELLREAYEHLSDPNKEPWMDCRANIIAKIKTALGDV